MMIIFINVTHFDNSFNTFVCQILVKKKNPEKFTKSVPVLDLACLDHFHSFSFVG